MASEAGSGDAARARAADVAVAAEGVAVSFEGRAVVQGVDLAVARGEIFVLMGPSGCGKSTLLRCLIGIRQPDQGRVLVEGKDLARLEPGERTAVRRRMGVAFQAGALFQSLTLLENVAFPLREAGGAEGEGELGEEEIVGRARLKLAMVGLAGAEDLLPAELSGGMRKRAAIARALALDPPLLFLDEPTSGLDPVTSADVDELVVWIRRVSGTTIFSVTHDVASASRIADRAALMAGGKLLALAPPAELMAAEDPRIADFVRRRASRAEPESAAARWMESPVEPRAQPGGSA